MAMGLTGASTLVRSVIKNFKYPGRTVVLRAVAAYPLTGDWRLADEEAVNRHRMRRQPDRGHVHADTTVAAV